MDRRKVFGIIGTIILGAIGSGVWELLKPLGASVWDALLTVTTLGLESVRDGLYESAARLGSFAARQAGANQTVGALICLTISIVLMRLRIISQRVDVSGHFHAAMPRVFLFFAIAMLLASTRTAYVVKVATYYEQLSVICAPYLDEPTRLQVASKAARALNRAEYLAAVRQLEQVLMDQSINFPRLELY